MKLLPALLTVGRGTRAGALVKGDGPLVEIRFASSFMYDARRGKFLSPGRAKIYAPFPGENVRIKGGKGRQRLGAVVFWSGAEVRFDAIKGG